MINTEKKVKYAIYKCFNCGKEAITELPFPISDVGKCCNCDAEDFQVIDFTEG